MDALTKIGMVMLSVILTVMSLELFAGLMAPPAENPRYLQISQGYENLAQLLKDKYVPKLAYHDYYLYSLEPASTKTVNFTNYFGARSTPDSVGLAEADELIWMFGGSTMQNLETEDRLSIANQMAVELFRNTVRAHVLNFGVGSFQSSMEAIKFQDLIRRVPINEIPTTVIFYDGFNDANYGLWFGAGNIQSDLSRKMRALVEGDYLRLASYAFSQFLSRYSVFWKDFIADRIFYTLFRVERGQREDILTKTVSAYVLNIRMLGAICKELSIRCLFILQPLVIFKDTPTPFEEEFIDSEGKDHLEFVKQFYRKASELLDHQPYFVDLSRMLAESQESDFYDLGHTSPFAGTKIGRALAKEVIGMRINHDLAPLHGSRSYGRVAPKRRSSAASPPHCRADQHQS